MVICGGRITGIVDGRTVTKEEVGLLMTKVEEPYPEQEADRKEATEDETGKNGK